MKFNVATQGKRQPGSSFKVFVLAEAIRQGISPETYYTSKNLSVDMGAYAKPYRVQNYNYVQRGPISVKTATEQSDNPVFVQLALDLGLKNVANMANKFGVQRASSPSTPRWPSGAWGKG